VAFVVASVVVTPASAASTPAQLSFSVCPNVTQTIYPGPAPGPGDLQHVSAQLGCAPAVTSANFLDVACTAHTNKDLGVFRLEQNPLGVAVQISTQTNCATNPPDLGAGVENGAFTVRVARAGFCPSTLTIPGRTGNATVVLPIGTLPFGKYTVTVDFPDQGDWSGTQASGRLRVGDTNFTETDTIALAKGTTFAVLLSNSLAGPGAVQLVSRRSGSGSIKLSGQRVDQAERNQLLRLRDDQRRGDPEIRKARRRGRRRQHHRRHGELPGPPGDVHDHGQAQPEDEQRDARPEGLGDVLAASGRG
jgi:hypothetical protein